MKKIQKKVLKVAILTGGPSKERGISLNSSRSVLDHLLSDKISIKPFYFDQNCKPYLISQSLLYSNTPSDFDFKISKPLNQKQLIIELKKCDIVFPVIHGKFGEDGTIQKFLEINKIPFVGSGSKSCKICFDKFSAGNFLTDNGFYSLPALKLNNSTKDKKGVIQNFFQKYKIDKAIVKPCSGGSSIGVYSVYTIEEALGKVSLLLTQKIDNNVIIEPFAKGKEFTIIILQNRFGLPVSIIPTEIEADYQKNQIFDYRKKYLPTRQVVFHCPPRFPDSIIEKIQIQAEQLFFIIWHE